MSKTKHEQKKWFSLFFPWNQKQFDDNDMQQQLNIGIKEILHAFRSKNSFQWYYETRNYDDYYLFIRNTHDPEHEMHNVFLFHSFGHQALTATVSQRLYIDQIRSDRIRSDSCLNAKMPQRKFIYECK